ncbi:MAG TPA: hypothetical protein VMT15_01320 [Bryobacteraceae bacterium]|nr:hypothetical protein [Bryobacteraceae bacterium]
MSETQLLSVALTTVPTMVVVLIGILINNARLNDVHSRLGDVKETLRAEMKAVEANMEKNHSEMLHRFGDLDTRLSRIENSLGMNRG